MKSLAVTHYARNFFLAFLPLSLLFLAFAAVFYTQEQKSQTSLLLTKERQHVERLRRIANDDIKTIISDLFLLSVNPVMHQLMKADNSKTRQALATIFKGFSESTKLYDQIRFIDETGLERVRINFGRGRPYIVADDKLQNKARRYYFEDTFQLDPGHVFVSPFDLNIEHGQIERPLKPMIRFGTPVVDHEGRRQGIVLLNYFGSELIRNLNQPSSGSVGSFTLINAWGYWLKGLKAEDEWGFMLDDRQDLTLANHDPESWDIISTREEGQFSTDQGIYTFATVRPLGRNMLSSTGSNQAYQASAANLTGEELYWKIVSLVTEEALTERKKDLIFRWLPFCGSMIVLIGLVSWGLSIVSVQRKKAAEERLYREKLQTVLEMAGAVCHELNQPMQVINGYCELLLMQAEDDDAFRGKISKIKLQIERMAGITKKLASITRYETTDYLDEKILDIDKSAQTSEPADSDSKAK